MRLMLWGLTMVMAGGISVAGDAKSDLGNLSKSKWTAEHDGKKAVVNFANDTFTLSVEDAEFKGEFKGTFRIDSSKKPKHMDLTITYKCKEIEGINLLAIFALDGDTLQWCAREAGPRPMAFPEKQSADSKQTYLIFKRCK
jgi:uncharacterized protein (TIGR03067 family)